jgi:hypothetical protein
MLNFKILSIFLVTGPQNKCQKSHQICSTGKFVQQNSRFLPSLGGICMGGTLRLSNFKILNNFSGF